MYQTIMVYQRMHVVCSVGERGKYSTGEVIQMPDYLGTGMALCGVVQKGDTLNDWIKKYHEKKH